MASASSDRVAVSHAEIAGFADTGRVHTIEPYTFARWVEMLDSSSCYTATELRRYADAGRAVRIQPYTFARWRDDLASTAVDNVTTNH